MALSSQQALVKGEQGLVDLEDVVVLVGNEILHDDVELAGVGESKARLLQHLTSLGQRQLQGYGKGHGGGLGGLVVDIRADLGEELAVDVGLFVALGVGHAPLVDLPQQHLGKALVQLAEGFVQAESPHGAGSGHPLRLLHGHDVQSHPAALVLIAVGVGLHIAVVDVGGDIGKELAADGVGGPVEDDQIDHHVVGEQELPDGIHRYLQRLVLGVAVHTGGNQRKGHGLASVGQGQLQRGAVGRDQQFPLSVVAAPSDGAYGVDDELRRQAVAFCDLGLSRFAAVQGAALGQQLRPGGPVDGPVHTSAAQQALVGGVDDGVHLHGGNIVSYNLQGHDGTSSLLVLSYHKRGCLAIE